MHHRPHRDVEVLVGQFRQDCRAAGMAITHQREVIFRALMEMDGHPSPEAIYGRVKHQIPAISLATVYKNLKTFIDTGLVSEVSLHHGALRLETNSLPHHHFVCTRCKEIFDLEDDHLAPVELRRELPGGFRLQRYSVEFQGLCGRCAAEAAQS
ncbi:MAG TPA: transcriptional repressor [Bryobacteraceae bacterium]|nr:transcriptional repressor [Bryobacteraceae bacterium]HPT29111.1 transcriptional repressor [Bryobacteraceae bacterium]